MDKMISLASATLADMKMKPYYLYRQKNIAGNLENTGYAKDGKECLYNVLIMEEKLDTFAAGAGGITRLLNIKPREDDSENPVPGLGARERTAVDYDVTRVDRVENVKSVDEYIDRIDEMLERKNAGLEGRTLIV